MFDEVPPGQKIFGGQVADLLKIAKTNKIHPLGKEKPQLLLQGGQMTKLILLAKRDLGRFRPRFTAVIRRRMEEGKNAAKGMGQMIVP